MRWKYKTKNEVNLANVTITPTTLDDSGEPQPLTWLESNDAQRMLGSHIAPDGSNMKQLDVLLGHLQAWQKALRNISTGNIQANYYHISTYFQERSCFL